MNTRTKAQNQRPGFSTADHWLRGGQVVGHTWDMTVEVIRKFSLPAIIAGFFLFSHVNHIATQQQQTFGTQAALVWFYKLIGPPMPRSISVVDANNISYVVTVEQFDATPWIQADVRHYQFLLMMSGIVWLLGLIALWSLLSVFFVKRGKEKIDDYKIRGQSLARLSSVVRLLRTYNADQVRKINFSTLEKMGIHDKRKNSAGTLTATAKYPIIYAYLWLTENIAALIDVAAWPVEFGSHVFRKSSANPEQNVPQIGYAGGADVIASEPKGLSQRIASALQMTRDSQTKRDAKRSSSDRPLRAFIRSLPKADRNSTAVIKAYPAAVYEALRDDSWAQGSSSFFHSALLNSVSKLAIAANHTFFAKAEDFMAPKILNIPFPYEAERQHTLVVGGTGSGKTVALNTLIDSIKERGDKGIVYDLQGDFTKFHYRPGIDKILNPFDKRSVGWSPFLDTVTKEDWYAAAEDLFEDGSGDPYWTEVPREIYARLGHVTTLLFRERMNRLPTVQEFVRILNGPHHIIYSLIQNTSAARALGEREGNRSDSLRSVIAKVTARMEHLVNIEANFSMKRWVNDPNERGLLFITAPEDVAAPLMPLISHWCSLATTALLSRDDWQAKQPTWIILDEFPNLKVPILAKSTALLRKFNGRVVIGMQQFSQLVYTYNEDLANTILGQMSNRLILRLNDAISAKFFSDEIGSVEKSIKDESTSFGASNIRDGVSITGRDQIVKIALPEELQSLPTFHGYLRFSPGNQTEAFPWAMVKYEPINRPVIAERCERIERIESIYDYLPDTNVAEEVYESVNDFVRIGDRNDVSNAQNSVVEFLQPNGQAGDAAQSAATEAVAVDADANANVARPDRELRPGAGDAAVAPINPETSEHAYEGLKNLNDRATKEELAKVNNQMAQKIAKESATTKDVIDGLLNCAFGGQISSPSAALQNMQAESNIVSKYDPNSDQPKDRSKASRPGAEKDLDDEGFSK